MGSGKPRARWKEEFELARGVEGWSRERIEFGEGHAPGESAEVDQSGEKERLKLAGW